MTRVNGLIQGFDFLLVVQGGTGYPSMLAVFLMLNTDYTANEVGYYLGDAEPALLVVDPTCEVEFSFRESLHNDGSGVSQGSPEQFALTTDDTHTVAASFIRQTHRSCWSPLPWGTQA